MQQQQKTELTNERKTPTQNNQPSILPFLGSYYFFEAIFCGQFLWMQLKTKNNLDEVSPQHGKTQ